MRPQLRLVLAISLDGRLAPAEGGAAQIGAAGDRRALEEALAWADACLIGANTLRLHGCTALIHQADLLEQRRQQGRPEQPAALVVSRHGGLDAALRFFQQPLRRGLIGGPPLGAACADQPPAGFDWHWPLTAWQPLFEQLGQAGFRQLVVLGGAQLAASLLEAGWVDELQLTLCPHLLGGSHAWLPAGVSLPPQPQSWRLLEQRCLGGDELLLRYARLSAAPEP